LGRILLIIGLFLAALAVGLNLWQRHMREKPAQVAQAAVPSVPALRGKPVPDFDLPNLEGAKVHPSDFKDKVLLVNFWATWCSPCIVEIPWFIEFQNKYGPKGFQVIGISLDETGAKDVVPFVKKHNMTYPVLLGDDKTADLFGGILGLPTTYIVDRNGKFYSMHRGLVSREKVEVELLELLQTPASSPVVSGVPPVTTSQNSPEKSLLETAKKN
jgi:thiol-disulfide isomerase/thioredoxin